VSMANSIARLSYNLVGRLPWAIQGPLWSAISWRHHTFNRIWTREIGTPRRNSRRWLAWNAWFEAHGIPADEVVFGEVGRFPEQKVITFRGFHRHENGGPIAHPETGLLEMLYIVTVDGDVAQFPMPNLLDRLNRILPGGTNPFRKEANPASLGRPPRRGQFFTAQELRSRQDAWESARRTHRKL
jgi:hypothetical protein